MPPADYLFVRTIATGAVHSLAVRGSRAVAGFGHNNALQLGTAQPNLPGSPAIRTSPVDLPDVADARAVAAGAAHTLVLLRDGKLKSTGPDQHGELGDGPQQRSGSVVDVRSGTLAFWAIGAGAFHSLAVERGGGAVWAWGRNDRGQLGDGTTQDRHLPVLAQGPLGVLMVAGGSQHSVALRWEGYARTVRSVGATEFTGGTTLGGPTSGVPDLSSYWGRLIGRLFGRAESTVWTWGANDRGQLGLGTYDDAHIPRRVERLANVHAVAAGATHCLALGSDGSVWAWGGNDRGQLGDGTTERRNAPQLVRGLPSRASAIAAGGRSSLALCYAEGHWQLWGWGDNAAGGLGDGTTEPRHAPVHVMRALDGDPAPTPLATGRHSLVARGTRLYACGANERGQLGLGGTADRHQPTQVPGIVLSSG